MSHTLSTIIVNYNAGPLLRKCVDSLLACPLDIEIIVVDNASSDASLDGLQDLSQVCVIRNPANVGFAAACNIGVQASSAPFLLFLNPDCFFQPDPIAPLLAGLQSGDRVGMVGGLLVNEDGTEQGGGRRAVPTPWRSFVRAFGLQRFANRWPKLFYDFHLHKQPLPDSPIEVEAISGACMLVKRDVMEDVGLWDEGYFLHCEDLDWCMRFRQNLPNTRNIQSFALGKYPVTQEEWSVVMDNKPGESKGRKIPVIFISWNEAQLFVQKLRNLCISHPQH